MKDLKPIENWGLELKEPLVIAGPCSVETREQLIESTKDLKSLGVQMIRGGIWKPRTRPGTFEGVGEPGLEWIKEVKAMTGLPVTVEVANANHVELALKYGVDVLWVGARSTVNPFTVQEIADALGGVNIPVMVKNPINPDLALWAGAFERFHRKGIRKMAAIHRGFSSYGQSTYRNDPIWQLPIAFKSEHPDIPMICDPSHIGGTRELILPISQEALDLDYSGVMIETHCDPDRAWSDAKQQVTPSGLGEILDSLVIRTRTSSDPDFLSQLVTMRKQIDRIDQGILDGMAQRMEAVLEIGDYKFENNVQIFQSERWLEINETRPAWGKESGLSAPFVQKLYKLVHDESIRLQTQLMQQKQQSPDGKKPVSHS
jgi:chorismate mutase